MMHIHTIQEQASLRASGRILARVMNRLVELVRPGITLWQLEQAAAQAIAKAGAKPAFVGYHGYKNILCTSVNDEVVHCPPTSRVLHDGDVLSIDAGVVLDGMYSDCAVTLEVGEVSDLAKKLIMVTRTALCEVARSVIKPGYTIGDIGHAIQSYVEHEGFSVVRQLVGHGIGRQLHEEPSIPNYGKPHTGAVLKPGMAIAVEPMVNSGGSDVTFQDDGWRVVTSDGSLSAHFEHTFLITVTGCEVLTELY